MMWGLQQGEEKFTSPKTDTMYKRNIHTRCPKNTLPIHLKCQYIIGESIMCEKCHINYMKGVDRCAELCYSYKYE